jgi:membrane fusion protein (multidrug efflux system)
MTSLSDTVGLGGMRKRIKALRMLLIVFLPLVAVVGGVLWYLVSGRYVSTDDAYVQADMVAISSNVPGRVVAVEVHDNEYVKAGQVLIRLDDRPYRIAVERAKAQLANARLQIDGLRATYRQKMAELQAAQDTLAFQQREFNRNQALIGSHIVSQAQFDNAKNKFDTARQQVASEQEQIANTLASLGGDPNIATDQHPMVQQAQAQLDQAELDLSYTVITAPDNGIVTKVDKLPVGNYLNAATPAFSLVETDHVWVEANFKETQLTHMAPGQAVSISADTYPGTSFTGHVGSVSPGTGSQFSVLPPQNATGNWVKVVQRLPVRIDLDRQEQGQPLLPGMSVTADVDTGYKSPLLTALGSFLGEANAKPAR